MNPDELDWENMGNQGKSFADMIDDFKPVYTKVSEPEDQELFTLMNELRLWWTGKGRKDAELVVSKYKEYGNTALVEVGQQLASITGREVSKAEAQELGIWFFMIGKMARWKTAILKGERVSEDTLDDLAVYAFMARRVHEAGGWPNGS